MLNDKTKKIRKHVEEAKDKEMKSRERGSSRKKKGLSRVGSSSTSRSRK
jgi:hypothetical protein